MAKASPLISSLNAGELSPRMEGRVDVGKYNSGGKLFENYIPMVQGPAVRRGGTKFVSEVKNSANRTWLVRFEFNVQQAYVLEFGDFYIRFYTNHGVLLSGGLPYEIVSPYSAADLTNADGTFKLRFVQSADVVYLAHPSYRPKKLSRLAATNWTITDVDYIGGPFKTINTTATTVYSSAATGAVTLTASSAIFQAGHVGSLFYLGQRTALDVKAWEPGKAVVLNDLRRSDGKNYKALNAGTTGSTKPVHTEGAVFDGDSGVQWQFQDPGYGYVKITGFTSTTVVTGTVVSSLPDNAVGVGKPSTKWAFGSWSDVEGWPSQVAFFKERLTWARGFNVWTSVSGDYETYTNKDSGGVVTADMAISIQLQSAQVNDIQWMESYDSLICGSAGAEFSVQAVTTNQVFGPENVTAPQISGFGSRSLPPVRVGDSLMFVQRSGLKLRDITYDAISVRFNSADKTVLAEHITQSGLTQLAYQQEPYSIVWGIRADGLLLGFTINKEQEVEGWHRHPIGGTGVFVESICTIPAPEGDRDELWMIVRRTINGVTKRYVEYMTREYRTGDTLADSIYLDSSLTYSGVSATVISGLGHLEGQTVSILANGSVQPDRVVTGGAITLQLAATKAQIGLRCTAKLQTMRLNAGAQDGTSQGKTARINKVAVRLQNTLGLKYGQSFSVLDELPFRSPSDPMDGPIALFTGDKILEWQATYDNDQWLCFQNDQPLPSTIIGIMPQVTVQDR